MHPVELHVAQKAIFMAWIRTDCWSNHPEGESKSDGSRRPADELGSIKDAEDVSVLLICYESIKV